MVAEARQWVDVEGAVREWARDYVPAVGRRVFFAPTNNFPQIVVSRIAGPDDRCLIQFDVWAGLKAQAVDLAADLATAADALGRYTHDGVLLHGAVVDDVRWQPDEESDKPRYIVDVTFFATSSQ